MASLRLDRVVKRYAGSTVIHGLDLELEDGSFTTLLGPSGCGKTTTLRCLAGLEVPDEGGIRFGDEVFVDVAAGRFLPPHKRRLGMVFQSYALWPNKTVLGNVSYPLKLRGAGRKESSQRATDALAAVGLGHLGDRFPHELSGGQQQRVALARGLVSASGLMLFDEPLSNLDAKLRLSMRAEVRRLHDEFGHTTVYVTHDQEEALAVSDHVIVMNAGRIEQAGPPQEIFSRPASKFVADFVGFENLFEIGRVSIDDGCLDLVGGGSLVQHGGHVTAPAGSTVAFRSRDAGFAHEMSPDRPHYVAEGRVRSSSYTGDGYVLVVELGADTRLVARVADRSGEQVPEKHLGETVRIAVPVERAVVL